MEAGREEFAAESSAAAVSDGERVDFAEEEAALAARDAGLELGAETAEEEAVEPAAGAEDLFAGKSKEELVELFARMIAERPVQTIRRDVEALKIAFYRLRRTEVEAMRRTFLEEGGAEEAFVPRSTAPRCASRSCSASTAACATNSSRDSRPRRRPI